MNFENKSVHSGYFYPIDLLGFWVVLASLISVLCLSFSVFFPERILAGTLFVVVIATVFFRSRIRWRDPRFSKSFLGVVLLAMLFRSSPFLYFSAGQDQGLYVLMSKTFENTHGLNFVDEFRQSLNFDERYLYDRNGTGQTNTRLVSAEESVFQFAFYPLNSTWQSLFGKIFGSDHRVYSLTFFALISIISIYLLVFEMTGSYLAGGLAAAILATNPYHAFFSKFPVSEMTALGLTTFGFYFLCRMWNSRENRTLRLIFGGISVLLFWAFFFARMTGVLYIPLIYLIVIAAMSTKSDTERIDWFSYYCAFLSGLVVSAVFYFVFYPDVLFPTFNDLLFNRLGPFPHVTAGALFICSLIFSWRRWTFLNKPWFWKAVDWGISLAFVGIVSYSCYIFYDVNWGDFLQTKDDFFYRIFLRTDEWHSLTSWTLVTLVCMVSPVGFIILASQIFREKKPNGLLLFSVLQFITFFGLIVWHNKFDFYQFYYTRFYITEVLPAAAIIISLGIWSLYSRRSALKRGGAIGFGVFTILWGTCLSAFQLRGHEGPRKGFFEEVNKFANPNDLLVFYKVPNCKEVYSPFRYYYDYPKTLVLEDFSDFTLPAFKSMAKRQDRVFILTGDLNLETDPRFRLAKQLFFDFDFFYNNSMHLYNGAFAGADEFRGPYGLAYFPVPTNYVKKRVGLFLFELRALD